MLITAAKLMENGAQISDPAVQACYIAMACIMVGGMVPPIGIALACWFFPKKFTVAERNSKVSNLVMGASFITEGAIPFTLVKPQFLIPINMFGAAVGTAVISLLGAKGDIPPVGGIYGFVSITNGWAYLVGILVGALIIALLATLVVDFTEGDEGETEDIDVDEIEITFEDIN